MLLKRSQILGMLLLVLIIAELAVLQNFSYFQNSSLHSQIISFDLIIVFPTLVLFGMRLCNQTISLGKTSSLVGLGLLLNAFLNASGNTLACFVIIEILLLSYFVIKGRIAYPATVTSATGYTINNRP